MAIDPVMLALELPDAKSFEQALLAQLKWEVGFEAAFVFVPGEAPTTVTLDPKRLGAALSDGRYEAETLPIKTAALRSQGVVVDTEVLGEHGVRSMRYHRELAAPIGGRHSLVAYLQARGHMVGLMMLGRTGSAFAARDVQRVREAAGKVALARASYGLPHQGNPLF